MLTAAVLFPSIVLAGEGATTWYCTYFNDSQDATGALKYITRIRVSNPNDFDAKYKIIYHKLDGSTFNDYTSSHVLSGNSYVTITPHADLNNSPAYDVKGNYIIEASEGSVNVISEISRLAGPNFGDSNYGNGAAINFYNMPVQTVTSTYLSMEPYSYYESNVNSEAFDDGEDVTWFHLFNPSDEDAEVTVKFIDPDGNELSISPNDGGTGKQHTFTISSHQTKVFTPHSYGIDNGSASSPEEGRLIVDVKKGSIIGSYSKFICDAISGGKAYRATSGVLNKRLTIQ